MTLHEAIEQVLRKNNESMKPRDIALEINKYSLYKRKDNQPLTLNQVYARVNKYEDRFIFAEGMVSLASEANTQEEDFFKWIRNLFVHNPANEFELLIPFLLYILKTSNSIEKNKLIQNLPDWTSLVINTDHSHHQLIMSLRHQILHELPEEFYNEIIIALEKVNKQYFINAIVGLNNFYDLLTSITDERFSRLFSKVITQIVSKNIKSYEFGTPFLLSRFIAKLVDIKSSQILFDPFAGFCMLLNEVTLGKENITVIANDLSRRVGSIGILNLLLSSNYNFSFYFSNAFENILPNDFDWIVSNPPIMKNNIKGHGALKPLTNPIELIYSKLKPRGKAIIVVPDSFLYSSDKQYFGAREQILRDRSLRAVISLPSNIFHPYSGIAASILWVEKNLGNVQVFFADYSSSSNSEFEYKLDEFAGQVKRKVVVPSQSVYIDYSIILNEESLNLLPRKNILNRRISAVDLRNAVRLRDLITRKIIGKPVALSNLNDDHDGIPYLRITDLSSSALTPTVVSPPSKYISDPELLAHDVKMIEMGTILLARIGNTIKPTIYGYHEAAVASSNILCFNVDESRVDIRFLVKELNSDYVKNQLDAIQIVGSGPSYFREKDLLDLKILLLPLEEQKIIVDHLHRETIDQFLKGDRVNKESFTSMVETIETKSEKVSDKIVREREIISSIKHRISQFVSPVSSDFQNLLFYYEKKDKDGTPVSMDDKISERENAANIRNVFSRINDNLKGIGQTFDLMNKILYYNKEDSHLEKVNITKVIDLAYNSVKERMENIAYILVPETSLTPNDLIVPVDKVQIEELLRNFFINSITHGFDETIPEKVISIYLTKNATENLLELNLINNGKPFPDGFTLSDFITFGRKGTDSQGTGIGGYLMNKIVDNHEGRLEWLGSENLRFSIQMDDDHKLSSIATIHFKISIPYINN